MRIRDIDDPELFQRLIHALYTATYGDDFEVVDDSGGDGGNDGYLRSKQELLAIYCPMSRPTARRYQIKIQMDLAKAARLRDNKEYQIRTWVFVTPSDLREPVQRFVRDAAKSQRLKGVCRGETHHQSLFQKNPQVQDQFLDLAAPTLTRDVRAIRRTVQSLVAGKSALETIGKFVKLHWQGMDQDARLILRIATGMAVEDRTGVYSSQFLRAMGSTLTSFSATAKRLGVDSVGKAESRRYLNLAGDVRTSGRACSGYLFTTFRPSPRTSGSSPVHIGARDIFEVILKYAQGPEARWLRRSYLSSKERGFQE